MSEISTNKSAETFLNREISVFKAVAIFVVVIFLTTVALYSIGQKYFWQPPQVQTPQERGLSYYQALVEREPEKPEHWVNLGYYYYQDGEYDKALEHHNTALNLEPEHFGALYNAGLTYIQLSEHTQAVEHLQAATELAPNNWEARLTYGVALTALEEWEQAETEIAAALELNWHSSDSHFYMGYLYEQSGRDEDAVESYQEAIQYNPQHVPATEGLQRVSDID